MTYSYKILIEPASKVSVPLTVVMRTRSSVPDSDFPPEAYCILEFPERTDDETQLFDVFCKQITMFPYKSPAATTSDVTIKAAVEVTIAEPAP